MSETMHYILLALREPLHGYAAMQKIEKMSNGTVIYNLFCSIFKMALPSAVII
jgi:DNA-binding PadR family transcriptional regulator